MSACGVEYRLLVCGHGHVVPPAFDQPLLMDDWRFFVAAPLSFLRPWLAA